MLDTAVQLQPGEMKALLDKLLKGQTQMTLGLNDFTFTVLKHVSSTNPQASHYNLKIARAGQAETAFYNFNLDGSERTRGGMIPLQSGGGGLSADFPLNLRFEAVLPRLRYLAR